MPQKPKSDAQFLNLVAEVQAVAIALKRVGERMAARGSSDAVHGEVLLQFFRERNVASALESVYLTAIEQIEADEGFTEQDLDYISELCGKKMKQHYGMKF